jgi:hypothetical protein
MDDESSLLSGLSAETAHQELTDPDSDTEDENEDLDFESLLKILKPFSGLNDLVPVEVSCDA